MEERKQTTLDFKCSKILHGPHKSIACNIPEKTSEQFLPNKPYVGPTHLPETYKGLAELFDHMCCSLRLLRLCKKSSTFHNVCSQVEVLAKRKFLYTDLAQMKYILPEAIHIEKVLIHDKRSLCMKPDLKITLVYEVLLGDSCENSFMALQKLFGSRLLEYFNAHPENTDIPEATLPEPFQQTADRLIYEDLPVDPSTILSPSTDQNQQLSQDCQPYPLRRHFSRKNVVSETENNVIVSQIAHSHHSSGCLDYEGGEDESDSDCLDNEGGQVDCGSDSDCLDNDGGEGGSGGDSDYLNNEAGEGDSDSDSDCLDNEGGDSDSECQEKATTYFKSDLDMEKEQKNESCSMGLQCSVVNTPIRLICSPQSVRCGSYENSHLKIAPSTDVKFENMTTQNSISSNKQAKRVLFSREEDYDVDKLESNRDACDNIPDVSQACTEDSNVSNSVLSQKVAKCIDFSHENTNQTQGCSTSWQQQPSLLIGLVDVIYSIFCSIKCSPITKEELLHKIITNNLDFVEMREAEEQINFLENTAPDWIYTKSGPDGGTMYCIKEGSNLESVRSRLYKAIA